MLCLGIESSCDDTCLALLENGKLIGEIRNSQAKLHSLFGGVVPELASREHSRAIGCLYDALAQKYSFEAKDLDLIAVARGPGLLGSLLVGVSFAKALAMGAGVKIIGVDHLQAHLLVADMEDKIEFPALGLLVSGGHTHLYRIEGPDSFTVLGKTLDDAAGEAFDKAGKMLGLPYPAGRHMDELSQDGIVDRGLFPRPYLDNKNFDFSFSGLKTSMQSYLRENPVEPVVFDPMTAKLKMGGKEESICDLCASYTSAIVETLAIKTERAIDKEKVFKSLVMAGGVAANSALRKTMENLAKEKDLNFIVPEVSLCADNAVMIAYAGFILRQKGYSHDLSFEAIPRGRTIPKDMFV